MKRGAWARVSWRAIVLWTLVWTAIALVRALQDVAQLTYTHQRIDLPHVLGERLLEWYSAGAVTPFYIWLVRRVKHYAIPIAPTLGIYFAAVVVGFAFQGLIYVPLENAIFHGGASLAAGWAYDAFSYSFGNAALFAAIIAVEHYRIAKEQGVRAARLESELAEAQLQMLRAQLDPHFLFNTLNSISALIPDEPSSAQEMIARLGDLLRVALDSSAARETHLSDEIEIARAYLDIMNVRFAGRLRYEVSVPPELNDEYVPNFVLQPLVENCIRHGMPEAQRPLGVTIEAHAGVDALIVEVTDDGIGLPRDFQLREGIGLSSIRRRLAHLYGAQAVMRIESPSGGGTRVTLSIPRRSVPFAPATFSGDVG
ncbi:MAG TPA: histidine kinase [Candidatus Baltobacteraceae bacterium]|nr:histidine kinase [Candidatus Baltobacteraceae bacterium]